MADENLRGIFFWFVIKRGCPVSPRIAHYPFNFLFTIESGANLGYALLTRYVKIWYLFFVFFLPNCHIYPQIANKHQYSHCLKTTTSRNPRIFNI